MTFVPPDLAPAAPELFMLVAVCVVLLVNVGLATIARTVPQVNIFVIGFLVFVLIPKLCVSFFQAMFRCCCRNDEGICPWNGKYNTKAQTEQKAKRPQSPWIP